MGANKKSKLMGTQIIIIILILLQKDKISINIISIITNYNKKNILKMENNKRIKLTGTIEPQLQDKIIQPDKMIEGGYQHTAVIMIKI